MNNAGVPEISVKLNEAFSRKIMMSFLAIGTSFSVSYFINVWMAHVGSAP